MVESEIIYSFAYRKTINIYRIQATHTIIYTQTRTVMKKTFPKKTLAAGIAAALMTLTATHAHAKETFIYGQNQQSLTVSTLNEDGKTLTRKLKYEYKHDENGQVIEKKAYRWDAYRELWKPAYLLTVTPGVYEIKLNYAEWNAKESTFNHNKQESIYREGNNANLLADTQNKK